MEAIIAVPFSISCPSRKSVVVVAREIIRVGLASIFLFSGLAKLRYPYELLASVYGYEMTGPLFSLAIATLLPWLEVLIALCLWIKVLQRGALLLAVFLTGIFSIALSVALYRQLDITCGCFLAADKISVVTLIRSLSLFGASIVGLVLSIRNAKSV